MEQVIILNAGRHDSANDRVKAVIGALAMDKAWRLEITEFKSKRSEQQNRLLWSIYTEILGKGGEAMGGWSKEDLHTFFLLEHFGSEIIEVFGRKRHVPLKRSSKLTRQEFSDYVEHIVRFMAEKGVYIEMPDDL